MTRLRILHLHGTFDLGGKEARTVKLMNHFGNWAEHVVLVGDRNAMGARDAIDPKIQVQFPENAPSLMGKPSMRRYHKIAAYMQHFNLTLSYNWGSMDGVMTHTLLGRKYGLRPLIHHEDGFNEDEREKLNWKRNLFRMIALRRSYSLVVPSLTLEQIGLKKWHVPKEKLIRIPNGIDVKRYQKKPQRGALPGFVKKDGEIIVGTVAGLRAVKNLPRLVRAVAAAGPNVRLAIAGDGPARAEIAAEAERLGMADRLIMPGFLKDPARYIGLFDIFALSSDSEQYPISLVEAMAAGCAVVSTDVGDVRHIVSKSNRPYIIQRTDEDGFNLALKTMVQDYELRQSVGTENAKLAAEAYQDREMFDRYRSLYEAAAKRADFGRQD